MSRSFRPSIPPEGEKFNMLMASLCLVILMSRYVELPTWSLEMPLLGLHINFTLASTTFILFIIAAITTSGVYWFFSQSAVPSKEIWRHLLLPALTALVIQLPLYIIPAGATFWFVYFSGCFLLTLVIFIEYLTTNPESNYYPWAALLLRALSFGFYLSMITLLRVSGVRLFILLPTIGISTFLVSLRTLNLFVPSQRFTLQALTVSWCATQLAAALHYLPLSPVQFGLLLLGAVYALITFIVDFERGDSLRQAAGEPIALFLIIWLIAHWVG